MRATKLITNIVREVSVKPNLSLLRSIFLFAMEKMGAITPLREVPPSSIDLPPLRNLGSTTATVREDEMAIVAERVKWLDGTMTLPG